MGKTSGLVAASLVLVFGVYAAPAFAGVTSSAGPVSYDGGPPPDLRDDRFISSRLVHLFPETPTPVALTSKLDVDITTPGRYDSTGPRPSYLSSGVVPKGTSVSSYLVHGDVGTAASVTITASATFDSQILGVMVVDKSLSKSDSEFQTAKKAPLYPTNTQFRGLDFYAGDPTVTDYLVLSSDLRTIDFRMQLGNALDEVRVITAVDTTAPTVTITDAPPRVSSSPAGSFSFTASESGVTLKCTLDGSASAPCVSPSSFTSRVDGAHTFSVVATDAAGNVGPPATYAWTVDTVAPDTTITSGPPGLTSSKSATLGFTATEPVSGFRCALDSALPQACTGPINYPGLGEGSHTFAVFAIDLAGNPDPSPATRTWVVDTAPPDTTITSGPAATITSSSTSLTFVSSEIGARFVCRLDSAPFTSCTTPWPLSGLNDGTHTFSVAAIDTAGNSDPTPAVTTWVVDTAPLDTTITSGPSGSTTADSAAFTFTSNKTSATFQCRLDAGLWLPCTSPATFASLSQGAHSLAVAATDATGSDATPATWTWTVDTIPPDTTILSGPAAISSSSSAVFTFASSEPSATFRCSLDSSPYSPCPPGATNGLYVFSGIADGPHHLGVVAVDSAGNVDPTPATADWTVDTQMPDTIILTHPASLDASDVASFTFDATEPASGFLCRVDGLAWQPCASPHGTSTLTDGPHKFEVAARDLAGNLDASAATYNWTIDTTAPDTSILNGPAPLTQDPAATFTFATSDPTATFQCRIDGQLFVSCPASFTSPALTEGAHTLDVRAIDPAGNIDPSPASWQWVMDTPPDTMIVTAPSGTVHFNSATVTFTSSKPSAQFECALDGSDFTPCATPLELNGLSDGDHTFSVRATDALGIADPSPATRTWTIQTALPPTLDGESLNGGLPDPAELACSQSGPSQITFPVSGSASGPYPGIWTGTITATITPNGRTGTIGLFLDPVALASTTAYHVTFTITSQGTTVSGTQDYTVTSYSGQSVCVYSPSIAAIIPLSGDFPTAEAGQVKADVAGLAYHATITNGDGQFTDAGTASGGFNRIDVNAQLGSCPCSLQGGTGAVFMNPGGQVVRS